jgi:DNA-binding MarR family transcriptional regulator
MDDTEPIGLNAPAIMKLKGTETDKAVLGFIRENPDSTINEIASSLEMSNGRVDHSVNRMRKNNFVAIQYFRRNRGLVKKLVVRL